MFLCPSTTTRKGARVEILQAWRRGDFWVPDMPLTLPVGIRLSNVEYFILFSLVYEESICCFCGHLT